jgi:hypothetical protein
MRNKRPQLDERQRCPLIGDGAATGSHGSMRDIGTGRQEATGKPAKQERLDKRQSRQMGGYATTSQIRGTQ